MIDQSHVFVILVNYNRLKDTLECIRSIYQSIVNASVNIVVVDNASKEDESIKIKDVYPDVISVRSKVNGGFSAGNNIGIKYALENSADYIMLLNNDTVIAPDMILFFWKNVRKMLLLFLKCFTTVNRRRSGMDSIRLKCRSKVENRDTITLLYSKE